jgi:subtilase family serine protease
VGETSEVNNTKARAVAIGPDLIAVVVVAPTVVPAGTTVSLTDTVSNQGSGAAGASTTGFFLSKNVVFDATDVPLAPGRAVPALATSASTGTTLVTIPPGTVPGIYFVLAKADVNSVVGESLETNNVGARAIQVTVAP